jgi:hypothetical protein
MKLAEAPGERIGSISIGTAPKQSSSHIVGFTRFSIKSIAPMQGVFDKEYHIRQLDLNLLQGAKPRLHVGSNPSLTLFHY